VAETIKLSILSPERRLATEVSVNSVTLPGSEGQIQILPGHAAMMGLLTTGAFRFQNSDGTEEAGVISTGFFEVKNETVSVMAETIELKGEIDVSRARQAQQKAETALQSAATDEHQFKKYQLKLQRALIRQQVADSQHQ
jgi:F-type H+-transporting ATPase subunit epsilon